MWSAWWVALEVIEKADPKACHSWITTWAVALFQADEAERAALRR